MTIRGKKLLFNEEIKKKSEIDIKSLSELLFRARLNNEDGVVAFAKLLTYIDLMGPQCLQLNELLSPHKMAFRVGITGPPGAGKSTLISGLLKIFAENFKKIGVLAVDPTSPISQGAILGDRIRYSDHTLNSKIFIRSLGTRGSLGGLSSSAYLMLRAFDACDFDIVLVETVGVGQVEVEIMNVADAVVVVLVPESGDSIQAMKAGITEIANLFIVNKSDRPGAESLKREIEAAAGLSENKKAAKVLLASALTGDGTAAVAEEIRSMQKKLNWNSERYVSSRLREEAKALMRNRLEQEATRRVSAIASPQDLRDLFLK